MTYSDLSSSDLSNRAALRILLQDQVARLGALRGEAGALLERSRRTISEAEWHGPAREAYERLSHQLSFELATVAAALDDAVDASTRGIRTIEQAPP